MDNIEFIQRAIDANALTSISATGTAINPNIWDFKLREYEEARLVLTQLAEFIDFRSPGVDYKVTFDIAPSAAAELIETNPISVSAVSVRQVVFTPTEYGKAFQVSQKEMNRSFFDTMDRFSKKLGYSLALKKDSLGVAAARTGASSTVMPNGKTVATTLASSDTLGYSAIIDSIRVIENHLYEPFAVVMNNFQKADILKLDKVNKANEFGTRDAVARGLIGELFGLQLYATTQITNEATGATNTAKALVLGRHPTGELPIAYAVKQDPKIAVDYDVLGRYHTIAAHEEYDWQVIHPKAIVNLQTWSA